MREYCIRCQKRHDHPQWRMNDKGWFCLDKPPKYEWTAQSVKESRKQYFNSIVQPYRDGRISKEFIEAHPKSIKTMIREGSVTKDEVKKSKYVWKDIPGWKNRGKSI